MDSVQTPPRPTPHWYRLYGLRVRSDVRLPLAPVAPTAELKDRTEADLVIQRMAPEARPTVEGKPVAMAECDLHGLDMAVYRGATGAWIWDRALGTCHVSPDARRVDVYAERGVDERPLGLLLAGPVAHFVLHKRGKPSLHAGAVIAERGAVAFLGPSGHGKTTMTGAFLRRGAVLLTDDTLPLELRGGQVLGAPGLPFMKVWRETAECTLDVSDDLPSLVANSDKLHLAVEGRYALATAPVPLQVLYRLDRYDPAAEGRSDVTIEPVTGREAVRMLLAQTLNRSYLLPLEEATLLPLYARLVAQAPVRVLRFPSGFEYQAAVHAHVLADMAALGASQ